MGSVPDPSVPLTATPKGQFKRWLFAPPRPHGAILKDRTVSNLEPLGVALAVGALAALLASLLAPAPWLLLSCSWPSSPRCGCSSWHG